MVKGFRHEVGESLRLELIRGVVEIGQVARTLSTAAIEGWHGVFDPTGHRVRVAVRAVITTRRIE